MGHAAVLLSQDEASPASLTDMCLSLVSSRLERFCVKQADGSLCLQDLVVFPQELADQLLCKMATEGKGTDFSLMLFKSPDRVFF